MRIKFASLRNLFIAINRPLRQWYGKFDNKMVQNGFIVNNFGSYVYSKLVSLDCVMTCLYVHDMLIFGTNVHVVNETKEL